MSEWTHPICDPDWTAQNGGRTPARLIEPYRETEKCCWCGEETDSGIYVWADPVDPPHHDAGREHWID